MHDVYRYRSSQRDSKMNIKWRYAAILRYVRGVSVLFAENNSVLWYIKHHLENTYNLSEEITPKVKVLCDLLVDIRRIIDV